MKMIFAAYLDSRTWAVTVLRLVWESRACESLQSSKLPHHVQGQGLLQLWLLWLQYTGKIFLLILIPRLLKLRLLL